MQPLIRSVLVLLALLLPVQALAQGMAMDPLNRVHAGVAFAEGPSGLAFDLGLDSRLTRLVFVGAGAFASPGGLPAEAFPEDGEEIDALRLRHGILLAPGIRLPHAQPAAFSWDLILRVGASAAWIADLSDPVGDHGPPYTINPMAAGFGGADVTVLKGHAGIRLGYRHFLFAPFLDERGVSGLAHRPQVTAEAVWQFGGAR